MYFLFNRTTLQVFVTYLIRALYVHPLWFCKHQYDNRVRSKLFVACQRWWFQWRFWFVPSVPGYLREEEEHKPDPWPKPIERNKKIHILLSQVYCVWQVVKTPTIISNNTVYWFFVFYNCLFILNQIVSLFDSSLVFRPQAHRLETTFLFFSIAGEVSGILFCPSINVPILYQVRIKTNNNVTS